MEPGELKSLFDAFYQRLVLRDFFGKIVPGLVLLYTVFACFARTQAEDSILVINLSEVSALGWIALFGAGWIVAFAIQGFGESFPKKDRKKRMIHYYPPELFPDDETWYQFLTKFQEKASVDERMQAERFVVIKEACGNGYVSIGVSVLFAVIFYAAGLALSIVSGQMPEVSYRWLFVLLFALFLMSYLRKMHQIHVERQYKYMKVVVERSSESVKS